MIPAFLITLREVIEATLIVATILGILTKLNHKKEAKVVIRASVFAVVISLILLVSFSIFGYQLQSIYTGVIEEVIEGSLMIISAFFITWAVFFLHKHFGKHKVELLTKINDSITENSSKGLFILTFTAVFREGFEIVLFLSTIYLTSDPSGIFLGASSGIVLGLLISLGLFTASIKMPVYYTFKVTSVLLVLFAAGLLGRGLHEFGEIGLFPTLGSLHLSFLPESTVVADFIKSIFGLTRKMDGIQALAYIFYVASMVWLLYIRNKSEKHVRISG